MEKDIRTVKNVLLALLAVVIVYLLAVLSSMLIPLALALFLAILLQPVLAWFERKRWNFGLSLVAISISAVGVIGLFCVLVYQTGLALFREKDKLLAQVNVKLDGILVFIQPYSPIELSAETFFTDSISDLLSADWILKSTGNIAGFLGDFTGLFFMTVLYLIVLLGGILKYEQYIHYLEEDDPNLNLLQGFEKVKSSIVTYIKVKFFTSLLTGVGYWLTCWIFGIDFALFWGYLAFILNFVPTVGSIVATIPPLLLALIQLDSISIILLFVVLLFAVQNIFGNILEPKMMGSSLSLNTISVLLGLVFWGYLWGITGMILSVPLLVLVKVILEQVPGASLIVRLMGNRAGSS